MEYRQVKKYLLYIFFASVLFFYGCAPQMIKDLEICDGAESAEQLLNQLASPPPQAVSFRANGRCLWVQKVEGKQTSKESFSVKLWVDLPRRIRLQGDIAFDARGIVLGSNDVEYWLAIKPKEISSYWWGRWEKGDKLGRLKISPALLFEAFGILDLSSQADWTLNKQAGFDVLTENKQGLAARKIYVSKCTSRAAKIEYFDENGLIITTVEMDKYKKVLDNFFAPRTIKIVTSFDHDTVDSFTIKLNSVKKDVFSEKKKKKLFDRDRTAGFKHVYQIVDGQLVEEK